MDRKPTPLCKAFLVCHEVYQKPENGSFILVYRPSSWQSHVFPATMEAAFYIRLSSGHGDYAIEVQLQNPRGEVLSRGMLPEPVSMPFPLEVHELSLDFSPVFPAPGDYSFVLTANGEEVAREPFAVQLRSEPVGS
jgi:hypothetical protein